MGRLIYRFLPVVDLLVSPVVHLAARLLKWVRATGVQRLPHCRNALMKVGVFPIRNHYYEPQFDFRGSAQPLSEARNLPGIDWNVAGQLGMLAGFSAARELLDIPRTRPDAHEFYFDNPFFAPGDAEYWYQLIRAIKPRRIFEVGSGYSTLMAIRATAKNRAEDAAYQCRHVCIEPYEVPWLEKTGVTVVRKRVEEVGLSFFSALESNDILFIDSSHVIRPQGDVLFEYLELLPVLNKGVIVHIHDIFSPRNYPDAWVKDEVRLWNEQYLVEAFLSHNSDWKIVGALNYLHHRHYDDLKRVAPFLTPQHEPGSLYIQKIA